MAHWARRIFARPPSPPRIFPTRGFEQIDSAVKLEEENWEWYKPGLFYPVRIGEVLHSRYQVLGKLGYGSRSTAWLCRDLRRHMFVTLKVCEQDSLPTRREIAAYRQLGTITTNNQGALLVRELLEAFKIPGSHGQHQCLVHEPLGISIETLRQLSPERKLPENVLKLSIIHLLHALDFLHTDAKMVHADLQARNIHLRIEEESILKDFEASEMSNPSPRKIDGDRIIYQSRGLKMPKSPGRPVLCDFGEARFGGLTYMDDVQPYVYRAPEVILDIPWTFSVDIWNVGVMVWDLFENKHLFNAQDENAVGSSIHHMAEMVAVLGLPPLDYLRRTMTAWKYFDRGGNWKEGVKIPNISFENSEKQLYGEDKALFLQFMKKMLHWVPEKRLTAKELMDDPWLRSRNTEV